MKRVLFSSFIIVSVVALATSALAQGSLTPPGAPGATMLTLSQVEPRTPVDAVHTPGNSTVEFAITNAGSYYLTTNLFGVSGKGGIGIYTNNVTLDLNGFSLQGVITANQIGIQAFSGTTNVIVQNGVVSGWGGDGVLSDAYGGTIQRLSVTGNGQGIAVQNVCVVKDCTVSDNLDSGIAVLANGCLISDNVCNGDNQANINGNGGIVVLTANNRIENNHLAGNNGYGIEIEAVAGGTNNMVVGNSVQGDGANDYFYSTSQIVGPIMTNNATGIITNANAWANFQF